jgi:hypothetical protein
MISKFLEIFAPLIAKRTPRNREANIWIMVF